MKQILELQKQYSKKRDEMDLVTRRLNSQAVVLAGTLQRVRDVVANLQEICEQFDGLEFIADVESHQEEPSSSITDPSSKSVSNASEAYDGSVSESESSGVDVDEGTTESSSERNTKEDISSQQNSPSFSISSNLAGKAVSISSQNSTSAPEKSFDEHRTSAETAASLLGITKTSFNRKKETKRAREETPCKVLCDKLPQGTSMGNVRSQVAKLPGMKYGRRNNDERDLDWLPVASLNANDVPADSKIKFQYEFGGQLTMHEGKVVKLGQDVVVVQTSSGLDTYWKKKMKDVMISSSAQAARI